MKTIYVAKAEKNDRKLEIKRRLMNYRNMPHPATGKVSSELVLRGTVKTRLLRRPKLLEREEIEEAQENDV